MDEHKTFEGFLLYIFWISKRGKKIFFPNTVDTVNKDLVEFTLSKFFSKASFLNISANIDRTGLMIKSAKLSIVNDGVWSMTSLSHAVSSPRSRNNS